MRNAKNLIQHELIGLRCKIVKSKNRYLEGIEGEVLDETMKTILIDTKTGRKSVMKKDAVFRFSLEKESDRPLNGPAPSVQVDVEGNFIIARPVDRIKKRLRKW